MNYGGFGPDAMDKAFEKLIKGLEDSYKEIVNSKTEKLENSHETKSEEE